MFLFLYFLIIFKQSPPPLSSSPFFFYFLSLSPFGVAILYQKKGTSIDTDEGLMEFLMDDSNFKD
jgi:hypothetical protein